MKTTLKKLLDLAEIDRQLLALKKLKDALPQDVARAVATAEAVQNDISEIESMIRLTISQIDKQNLEINVAKEEIKKLEEKIGKIKNNKEYQIITERIKDLQHTIKRTEDREIPLMEELENHKKNLTEKKVLATTAAQELAAVQAQVAQKQGEIKTQQQGLIAQRKAQITECENFAAEALKLYMHALQRGRGVACAPLVGGVCGECHRKASANLMALVRVGEHLDKTACGGCGRILYIKATDEVTD